MLRNRWQHTDDKQANRKDRTCKNECGFTPQDACGYLPCVTENRFPKPGAFVIDQEYELLSCAGKLNDINKSYDPLFSLCVAV